jgi:aminocarboxymuconate-semialdehyde decarboxylase
MADGGMVHDVHAHFMSGAVEALVATEEGRFRELAELGRALGPESVKVNQEMMASLIGAMTLEGRLAHMDATGVDVQVLSISPSQYHYWAEPDLAGAVVGAAHAELAELIARAPDRLRGFGTVSLQHPGLVAGQVRSAVREHGLDGIMVSTSAGGRELSHDDLDPLWTAAEEVGAAVFIHPWGCSLGERLDRWYLFNLVGQLTETAVALSHLIFGGVLDRHPDLRVCAAHGGGYLPSSIGRSDRGWDVRPESRTCAHRPSEYLRRLWFDSVVHDPAALRSLIDRAGASQVVLGTDYPFDMGLDDPVADLERTPGLTEGERSAITSGNFERLLGGRAGR